MHPDSPGETAGLRHVAMRVREFDPCVEFYTDLMDMSVEWRPDEDTVFLTSGNDNLALYRSSEPAAGEGQRLDHVGFVIETPDEVDRWHDYLAEKGVPIVEPLTTHRDGARSFFCSDPDGTRVQVIHHPPLFRG